MKTLLIIFSMFISQLTFGQQQYQKAMGEALTLWQNGKAEEAIGKMERIASVEKENWIPRYYTALIATISSFQTKDADKKNTLLKIASENIPQDEKFWNAEWYILKSNMLTSELVMDPMNNAMRLSPLIVANYKKALALEPNNPRAMSGLASYNIQRKKFNGGNTDQDYKDLEKAVSLFADQKSDIPFYPSWGKEQAVQLLNSHK